MNPFKKKKKFGSPHEKMESKSKIAKTKVYESSGWFDEIDTWMMKIDYPNKIIANSIHFSEQKPPPPTFSSQEFKYTLETKWSSAMIMPSDFVKLQSSDEFVKKYLGRPPRATREDTEAELWDE